MRVRLRGGAVASMLTENFGAIFNGDGYSQEWQVQVDKRGVLSSAEGVFQDVHAVLRGLMEHCS